MSDAALIVGASGGIGAALTNRWRSDGRYARVFTASRQSRSDPHHLTLDLTCESSLSKAAEALKTRLNGVSLSAIVVCSGLLHGESLQPERRLGALDADAFTTSITVNALGPLLVAKYFSPLLSKTEPSHLLALSARVGSISDNRLGGWFSYRCSKAALNQGFQTLAVELRRTHPKCVVTLFHPGTVDTGLSKPFQRNVPAAQLFSPARAARQLDEVMHARRDPSEHIFVDWAGKPVAF